MTKVEDIFFSLLRAALWETDVQIPEGFAQWGRIIHLARTQALSGLIGDVLLSDEAVRNSLPVKFVEGLQDIPKVNIGMHVKMNRALQLLVMTLNQNGIKSVLLKGQGLAQYYPVPELRQCGDIDLYVGEENYEKTYDAIRPIVSEIDDKDKIWRFMHFHAKVGSVVIEVHHKADVMYSRKKEKIYREFMLKGLTEDLTPIKFGEVQVMTPNDTYNAFYVFYHLWRHFSTSGVGLRQFCDWTCFLHTHVGKLDLPYLKTMLEKLGFMRPWQVFGCFLVKDMGLPKEEFPFYDERYASKVARVREYVMTDGNFGINVIAGRERKRSYLHGKWVSLKFHIMRFFRMFAIFPKHTMLRLYYMLRDGIAQVWKDLRIKV